MNWTGKPGLGKIRRPAECDPCSVLPAGGFAMVRIIESISASCTGIVKTKGAPPGSRIDLATAVWGWN
jgi:hypothetical protein